MRLTGGQNIPSALLRSYKTCMLEAREKAGKYTAEGRVRFSLYGTRRYKIKGLDFVDYNSHCSKAQAIQRNYFRKGMRCFAAQPKEGGAVPPALGPRDREYWYLANQWEELIYSCYFQSLTLNKLIADEEPDWCIGTGVMALELDELTPNHVGTPSNNHELYSLADGNRVNVIIPQPLGHRFLRVFLEECTYQNEAKLRPTIHFLYTNTDINFDDVTWNNTRGIWTIFKSITLNARKAYSDNINVWFRIDCPSAKAILITSTCQGETEEQRHYTTITGSGYMHRGGCQPFWTIT